MAEFEQDVEDIINSYVKKNTTLSEMEEIVKRHTGKSKDFVKWEEVFDYYQGYNWNQEAFDEFLYIAKDVVESGVTTMTEAYLLIRNKTIDISEVTLALSEFNNQQESSQIEYEVTESGHIDCRLTYEITKVSITSFGEMERLVEQKSIAFEIQPSINLVIVRENSPSRVSKIRSSLNSTNMVVSGVVDLSLNDLDDSMHSLINSFEHQKDNANLSTDSVSVPVLVEVVSLDMTNPAHDSNIRSIHFSGHKIDRADEIREYEDEGWVTNGFESIVRYAGQLYSLRIYVGDRVQYIKLEEVSDYDKGLDLLEDIRDRFLAKFVPE